MLCMHRAQRCRARTCVRRGLEVLPEQALSNRAQTIYWIFISPGRFWFFGPASVSAGRLDSAGPASRRSTGRSAAGQEEVADVDAAASEDVNLELVAGLPDPDRAS